MVKEILKEAGGKILSYMILAVILAVIIYLLWQKINWPALNLQNPFGGDPYESDHDKIYSFSNGRGGSVRVNTGRLDCHRPLRYGDTGDEVKVLQGVLNEYLKYEGFTWQIKVNGRFGEETQRALEDLDSWIGPNGHANYGYSFMQFNTGFFLGEDAPCNFYS